MYRSVHLENENLAVDIPKYLRRHDVVYHSPAYRACEGLPVGNGCFGGMLYHDSRSIRWMQNHTDAIDFGPEGNFQAWAGESEEINTAPVSCGEISLDDGMPSFEWVYLKDYEARLNLAEGCAQVRSETPFSRWDCRAFAVADPCVSVLEARASSSEPVERTVRLEKWSSPNFFHYYEQIVADHEKNLNNIESGEKEGCVYLRQQLRGTDYILAAKLLGETHSFKIWNSHCCGFSLPRSKQHCFTLLTTSVVCQGGKASLDEALSNLHRAEQTYASLFESHRKNWESFWKKSFISLPDDDYLENLYYINLYQLNCCSRGKYPLTFAGIWNTYRDSRNWGHFYHWNHQQTYWGLNAAGHQELEENYLDYRFRMLENARRDARETFRSSGAFYSDVSNLNGYNALEPDTMRNFTVGPQITMNFYRHYQYTRDQNFLISKACPVMLACADFYCHFLTKEHDGFYRIRGGSSCYESYWNNRETVTDRAMIPALLNALLNISDLVGLDEKRIALYRDILDHLYPVPTLKTECGEEILEIFADGVKWDGETMQYAEGTYPLSAFPGSQLAMVYPSGTIGIKDRPGKLFSTAVHTARVIFDRDGYQPGPMGCSGHTPLPQVAARLGMGEDALKLLHHYICLYQPFPNGLMHFQNIRGDAQWPAEGFHPRIIQPGEPTQWEKIHEKDFGTRTAIPSDVFLHCYFESAGNLTAGLEEMLLQSYDGVLRVFPAVPQNYSARFSLWAAGAFQVISEKNLNDIRYICVKSTAGGSCSLQLPWQEPVRLTCDGSEVPFEILGDIIQFETKVGMSYLLERNRFPLENYYLDRLSGEPNQKVKTFGGSMLGKEKIF